MSHGLAFSPFCGPPADAASPSPPAPVKSNTRFSRSCCSSRAKCTFSSFAVPSAGRQQGEAKTRLKQRDAGVIQMHFRRVGGPARPLQLRQASCASRRRAHWYRGQSLCFAPIAGPDRVIPAARTLPVFSFQNRAAISDPSLATRAIFSLTASRKQAEPLLPCRVPGVARRFKRAFTVSSKCHDELGPWLLSFAA